jgi:hypothetical protein
MPGLFFFFSLRAPAQKKQFVTARGRAESHFQTFVCLLPVAGSEFSLESLQQGLRWAHDVTPPLLPQEPHILFTHHTAIQNPGTVSLPVLSLDLLHDFFQSRYVVAFSGEQLIARWHPLAAHYQRNVDLLTIRTAIARITPLGQLVSLGFTFEVRAGDDVQQPVVVEIEQFPQPILQIPAFPVEWGPSRIIRSWT